MFCAYALNRVAMAVTRRAVRQRKRMGHTVTLPAA